MLIKEIYNWTLIIAILHPTDKPHGIMMYVNYFKCEVCLNVMQNNI